MRRRGPGKPGASEEVPFFSHAAYKIELDTARLVRQLQGVSPPGAQDPLPDLLALPTAERWARLATDPQLLYLDVAQGLLERAQAALGRDLAEAAELAQLALALRFRLPPAVPEFLLADLEAQISLAQAEIALAAGESDRVELACDRAQLLLQHGSADPQLLARLAELALLRRAAEGDLTQALLHALRIRSLGRQLGQSVLEAEGWIWAHLLFLGAQRHEAAEEAWTLASSFLVAQGRELRRRELKARLRQALAGARKAKPGREGGGSLAPT